MADANGERSQLRRELKTFVPRRRAEVLVKRGSQTVAKSGETPE
jgi:hypothetical protein